MNRWVSFLLIFIISGCDDPRIKKEYYPSGEIKLEYSVDDDMKKDGIQKEFWENGEIKGVYEWNHGVPDGTYQDYFSSGKPSAIGHFTNGLQDSIETIYYENGKIKTICYYENGERNGKFYSYFQNGSRSMIADSKNDTTIRSIQFDSVTNKVIRFNVGPGEINIPKNLSRTDKSEMSVIIDTAYIRYVDLSVKLYNNAEDYFKGGTFAYSIPVAKTQNGFSFHLPDDAKKGDYFVSVTIEAINPATDHLDITFPKEINIEE